MIFKSIGASFKDYSSAVAQGTKRTTAFADAIKTITPSAKFTIAGIGISSAIGVFSLLNELHEQQIKLIQKGAEEYSETRKSMQSYKEEAIDLINSLESGILSEEETYSARARLYEIENEMSVSYGTQADGLHLLTQSAHEAAAAFDDLAKSQADQYLSDPSNGIDKAFDKMTDQSYRAGHIAWDRLSSDSQKYIEDWVAASDGLYTLVQSQDGMDLVVNGTANEVKEALEGLNTEISAIDDELAKTDGSLSDYFLSYISRSSESVGKIVDNYGSTYAEAIRAMIIANDEYSTTLTDLENAESAYTKAATEDYDSAEERAKAMAKASDTIDNAIKSGQGLIDGLDLSTNKGKALEDFFSGVVDGLKDTKELLDFEGQLSTLFTGGEVPDEISRISTALSKLQDEIGTVDSEALQDIGLGFSEWKDQTDLSPEQLLYKSLHEAIAAVGDYGLQIQDVIPILREYGLVSKTTSNLLGDATSAYNKVTSEQAAVSAALKAQGSGKSVDLETYKSLIALSSEYADCLEYVNGTVQLNRQEMTKLSKVRAEENLLTIESNKLESMQRYAENARQIANCTTKLNEYTQGNQELNENEQDQVDKLKDTIEALKEKNETIKESIAQYDLMAAAVKESISAYSEWVNAQSETQSGAWHESVRSGLEQIKTAYKNKEYGNTALQEGLEFFTGNDTITGLDSWQARVVAMDKAYKQLTTTISGTSYSLSSFMQGGRTGANNFLNAVQQLNKEWASFDYATQEWTLNYDNAELADALGTTEDFVVMMNELLELYGFEFEPQQLTTTEEKLRSLEERAASLRAELEETNFDSIAGEEQLRQLIEDIENAEGLTPEVKTEQLQDAYALVDEFVAKSEQPVFMEIKTAQVEESLQEPLKLLQNFQTEVNNLKALEIKGASEQELSAAQASIESIAGQIAELPPQTLLDIGLNLDGVAENDLASTIQAQLPDVNIPVQSDIVVDENKTVLVTYRKDSTEVDGYNPPNLERTVTYNIVKNGSVPAEGYVYMGSGYASGTAHASGSAKATGDFGSAPGGKTLVGELGQEMFVDPATNTWQTIGDNGAEFVNLPKNAIVFNHRQTKSLLTSGKISARGKALASGNAAAHLDPLKSARTEYQNNLNARDADYVIISADALKASGGPVLTKGSVLGGSGSSGKDKDNKKSFEELYKKHQHLLAMEKETDEEYLKWLEKAYKKAYKNGEISLDDYRKYAEEVYEGQKELFKDSLNDMEHQIGLLERESGNESDIIKMYKKMMKKIKKEIAAAKKRGLDDNSDYVQELREQYNDYADEITDIEDEIKENAMDAVEELVDFRLDMIKQDLENEKDALNDKLDDLRDFYDKQKEMLQDARDEEKYLEEQSEKRKSVSDIEGEIARLSRDDSAWAQKRRLELQEELKEARKELDDFEKDHALDTTQDLLDEMYEQQTEQIESQIEAIEEKLNDPKALYNQALKGIQDNTASLYGEMVAYNDKYGSGNSEDVQKLWDEAYESLDAYFNLFNKAYKDIVLAGDSKKVSKGYAGGTRSATPGIHPIFEEGEEYIFTASDGSRYKMFSGGEKVLNAQATNFLYDFATSGGAILSTMIDKLFGAMNVGNLSPVNQTLQLSTGDIIIQGNASSQTVSEIRRAQRDSIDYILKEFHKLNR